MLKSFARTFGKAYTKNKIIILFELLSSLRRMNKKVVVFQWTKFSISLLIMSHSSFWSLRFQIYTYFYSVDCRQIILSNLSLFKEVVYFVA